MGVSPGGAACVMTSGKAGTCQEIGLAHADEALRGERHIQAIAPHSYTQALYCTYHDRREDLASTVDR